MRIAIGRVIEAIPGREGRELGKGRARPLSYLRTTADLEDNGGPDMNVFNASTLPIPAGKVLLFRASGKEWLADVSGE